MTATTLLQQKSITVSDFRCSAGPDDTPFVERHRCHSVSYVREGSFGCRTRGRFFELVAGSILVGHPGDEYMCTHDHVCGDECLSFFLTPELVEAIGDRAEVWQIGSAPPLPELMVLGELAQAAADGRSDIFSLGVVVYEILSGKRPFEGDTITTLVYQILHKDPPPISELRAVPQAAPSAETLLDRWRRLPKVDPLALREDIDRALDPSL